MKNIRYSDIPINRKENIMSEKTVVEGTVVENDTETVTETPAPAESRFNKKLLMKIAGYTTGAVAFLTAGYLLGVDSDEDEDEETEDVFELDVTIDEDTSTD